jgi:ADP-ribosylation factor related protein 1
VKGLSPEQIGPTVGMNMGKIIIGNSKLNFWDLGGQQHLLSLWDKYYSTCDGIIFVVDSTDTSRIEEVNSAFEGIMKSDLIGDVPVLMLANKQDLPEAMQFKITDIDCMTYKLYSTRLH